MILYFTGTGNSRFAARRLAQRLGDQTVSLGQVFRNKQPLQFHSASPFVVVCPIYAGGFPSRWRSFWLKENFPAAASSIWW